MDDRQLLFTAIGPRHGGEVWDYGDDYTEQSGIDRYLVTCVDCDYYRHTYNKDFAFKRAEAHAARRTGGSQPPF